ncbi:hypothetical protein FCI59_18125 [Pseudomonas protegens]|nr:hypothetical protein [Pseudomonas sp. JV245A]NAN50603.1 hypothetical protein [Pseudomonas protegens]NTZ73218.1 hypothetical protein [Pseudomonas protegens]NUE77622.1 hypothetical protein [Pseudomonas protegens]
MEQDPQRQLTWPLRRSRLAGEEGLKPCVALGVAFAGRPAPTPVVLHGGRQPVRLLGAGVGGGSFYSWVFSGSRAPPSTTRVWPVI